MCYKKIIIVNNSHSFNPFSGQKLYYVVPCYHCEACRRKRQNDYVIRAIAEMDNCRKNGGFVFADTLTYSDQYLPTYFNVPVFSRRDITLFFKNLRAKFIKYGYYNIVGKSKVVPFKYLLVSEYGFTFHRPHYHLELFVYCNISPSLLNSFIRDCWLNGINQLFTEDYDISGKPFQRPIRPEEKVLNNYDNVIYITKYIGKDDEFVKIFSSSRQIIIDNLISSGSKSPDQDFKNLMRKFQPFLRISQNFGLSLMDGDNIKMMLSDNQINAVTSDGLKHKINIPRYYVKRLCFDYSHDNVGNIRYELNNFGYQYFKNVLSKIIDNYNDFLYDVCINKSLYGNNQSFCRLLGKYKIDDYSKYSLFFRGRCFSPDNLSKDFVDIFLSSYLDRGNIDLYALKHSMRYDEFQNYILSLAHNYLYHPPECLSDYIRLDDSLSISLKNHDFFWSHTIMI